MKNIYTLFCGMAVVIFPLMLLAQNGTDVSYKGSPARDTPNVLNVHIAGGDYNYEDNLYIYFWEGATTGYDIELEAIKWYSINPDATMIWSIAEDGTELAINAMPLSCLYNGCTSIPIHFQCGYDDEYTLTFSGMDTFEYPTEFWLEDLNNQSNWLSVNDGSNTYRFNGQVSDSSFNRFIIHFMDPTGVHPNPFDAPAESNIKIYASTQYAVIETDRPDSIRGIQIFDLVGNEIYMKKGRFEKLSKLYVSGHIGYYFVKVVTATNIYSQKIFIGY